MRDHDSADQGLAQGRQRAFPLIALALAIILLPASLALAANHRGRTLEALDHSLANKLEEQTAALSNYYERARAVALVTANNPAFADLYVDPASRLETVKAGGPIMVKANMALGYLEELYPDSIGEVCFIDAGGAENARVVRGDWAPLENLSPDESGNPFFAPTFALEAGQVHQSVPYESPDTFEWVISNSTPIPSPDGAVHAIVHFEVTVESFRRQAAAASREFDTAIVDARTGGVIIDSRYPQEIGAPLGRPEDQRFTSLARSGGESGAIDVEGRRSAYQRLSEGPTNANDWYVVVTAPAGATSFGLVGVSSIGLVVISLLLLGLAISNLASSDRELRTAATTDALTGLANRRKLNIDLRRALAESGGTSVLALYDLNGFKLYNDTFGHPAGDALLERVGGKLSQAMSDVGSAYRMGGDEFCILARIVDVPLEEILARGSAALSERGDGFQVNATCGWVLLPEEASHPAQALRLADERMYLQKRGTDSARRQSKNVLVRTQRERDPGLAQHLQTVASLSFAIGEHLGLEDDALENLSHAAELHDVGKVAVPDTILRKRGNLSDQDHAFLRRHTLVGERILSAAPALNAAGVLVRSSRERFDGQGYPDGLAGDAIPLGSRIIGVACAFDSACAEMGYDVATLYRVIESLRAKAGTRFDPKVVEALNAVVSAGWRPTPATATAHTDSD